MPEARAEDLMDPIAISIKPLVPAIPRIDRELQELAEDLWIMGCEGLLAKPWNLRAENTLREFKYDRGNQWDHTHRRDPDNWTLDVWNRVYGFPRGILEGWARRRDGLFVGIQRRCRSKERLPPGDLQEQEGEKGAGIFATHLEFGQAQTE